jgi:acetylornithine deacetylase/succinyl-diaminopimelate desuccinylase-like protein
MDSGCEDYKRLWLTSSLRGVISIDLKVSLLKQGIHSGIGGGLCADSFMVLRNLIDRIEDPLTAKMLVNELFVDIPEVRRQEIKEVIKIIGDDIVKNIPFENGVEPLANNMEDLIINNTWKPYLCITGADGLPVASTAGNVLRPYTQVKLSIRLPPLVDSKKAGEKVCEIIKKDPPYNSIVEANVMNTGDGWNLNNFSQRIRNITNTASQRFYDENVIQFAGEGGSIPFVQILNNKFKNSDLLVLGVTGPGSNIHGVDENLDMDYCRRLICCLAYIISDY